MANLLYPASTGHITDDKYASLVEPNLFAGNVFQPGITFTDKYQMGPAGQIMVHKMSLDVISSSAPGADFSHVINQDELITIQLDKQFNRSRKIYGATMASVAYPIAAGELEMAIKEVKTGWNAEACQALIGETSILVSDNVLTVLAGDTIFDQIVDDRAKMRTALANPDTLLVSPNTYAKILKSPEFQRSTNMSDQAIGNGIVGRIAGLNVVEYETLDAQAVDAATIGGITWATADELEYVMYEMDAFSIVTSVNLVRVVDHPDFNGTLAQVEIVSGYKLTNPGRALLKYHDDSAV